MNKYNSFFDNLANVLDKGFGSTKKLRLEFENFIKFKVDEVIKKLNLVTREEFEVQQELLQKLQNKVNKKKARKVRKS